MRKTLPKTSAPHCHASMPLRLAMALLALVLPVSVAAQYDMVVKLKDGTTMTLPTDGIERVTVSEQAEESALAVSLDEVSEIYAKYTVAPKDEAMTYNVMWLEKAEFDKYASDEDVVRDDLKYYQELADGYGMSLSDVLASFLIKGHWEDWCIPAMPDTDYVLWAYGLDSEGKQTTPLQKVTFRTKPVSDKTDLKVDVGITEDGADIAATFEPQAQDLRYTAGRILAADMEPGQTLGQAVQQGIGSLVYEYLLGGLTVDDYMAENTSTGGTQAVYEGLAQAGPGYVVAAFVNANGAICSPVTAKAFGGAVQPDAARGKAKAAGRVVRHAAKKPVFMTNHKSAKQ